MMDLKRFRYLANKIICGDATTEEVIEYVDATEPKRILELLNRLESAETEVLEQARLNGIGSEREAALLAKVDSHDKMNRILARQLGLILVDWRSVCNCQGWNPDSLLGYNSAMEKLGAANEYIRSHNEPNL